MVNDNFFERNQKLFNRELISDEIAEYSGIAYTTAREMEDGIIRIDKHK